MQYLSTRGGGSCGGAEAVLRGPAPDGGLYALPFPLKPDFDVEACLAKDYLGIAEDVLSALLPDFEAMGALLRAAYAGKFDTPELTPLVPLGDDYMLELFHGPTSAFKDVALSVLPRLMTAAREKAGLAGDTVVLTATSGDTGKAALEGFRDVPGTRIVVFYPAGGVSEIQRRQMVCQQGGNVRVCAVSGNFDDCQSAVKAAFSAINEGGLLAESGLSLSSANSINIGRLAPQAAYYFYAYSRLLRAGKLAMGDKVDFVVPTGNFGDILAGYYAKLMGLPVGTLVCASNANRVLTDFFETGFYDRRREFLRTTSPSMDILISSNLERLLFHVSHGDTALVRRCMAELAESGCYTLPAPLLADIRGSFDAGCCDEAETAETIARVWRERRYLCDPHTAVAVRVAEDYKARRAERRPLVVLSTASPFKFPGAVLTALGERCEGGEFERLDALSRLTGLPVPKNLAALRALPELHGDRIEPAAILPYIKERLGLEP